MRFHQQKSFLSHGAVPGSGGGGSDAPLRVPDAALAIGHGRGGVMATGALGVFPAARARQPQILASSRRSWSGTPEVYFPKFIDNSRLVRVADRRRSREMA